MEKFVFHGIEIDCSRLSIKTVLTTLWMELILIKMLSVALG